MFKKRRQRAKKYTLTCFGKAPEDKGSETEGETEEEGGSSILSGSELDEEGFSASYDPTWDSGYLDLLDRRSSACPSTTPTTPTTDHSPALDFSVNHTPSFVLSNSTVQSPKLEAIPGLDTTSLYIPARNTNGNSSDMSSIHSPPSSLSSATTISVSAANPATFAPPGPVIAAQPYNPPAPQQVTSPVSNYYNSPPQLPTHPSYPYPNNVAPIAQPYTPEATPVPMQPPPPPTTPVNAYFNMQAPTPQVPSNDSLASREQRIAVPAARTGILHDARKRSQKKPMFSALQSKDVNPNPDLVSMVQNMDDRFVKTGHESGPEEDWLRLGAEACNFMQAQRQPKPPPVAPKPKSPVLPQMQEKPQAPQMPVLGGKGGQLFAKRQNRMDRYVVERSPSVVAMPYSPAQTREPSPTPSLPATWKYSSSIRAPPPINYNPLLSPSCPLKAQKKQEPPKSRTAKSKKQVGKAVDVMKHQPYQLSSSLFSYGGNTNQDIPNRQPQRGTPGNVHKTAKVIVPRSATTLGEPMWRSDIASPPPQANSVPYQAPYPQQQWGSAPPPVKSVPDLSPLSPQGASSQFNSQFRGPRPRFSTSNLGLQPCVWRPGSTLY
uniref:Synaptopodin 2-like b n=1 Tax=Neogobius melanostomus TaxID=47308 RepID=A0A8C6UZ49_9GOBI